MLPEHTACMLPVPVDPTGMAIVAIGGHQLSPSGQSADFELAMTVMARCQTVQDRFSQVQATRPPEAQQSAKTMNCMWHSVMPTVGSKTRVPAPVHMGRVGGSLIGCSK